VADGLREFADYANPFILARGTGFADTLTADRRLPDLGAGDLYFLDLHFFDLYFFDLQSLNGSPVDLAFGDRYAGDCSQSDRSLLGGADAADFTRISVGSFGLIGHGHLHIDVFEDVARGDAEYTVKGLDQIVTFASAVLPAKMVGEGEAGIELFGFD